MRWLGAMLIIALLALSSGLPSASSQVDGVPQEPDGEFRLGAAHLGQVVGDIPIDNTTLWVKEVESPVKSSPVVIAGRVFVGTMDGDVLCLSDSTGSLLWSFSTGGAIESSPAVLGDRVYVGSDDSRVYCLDTLSGEELWNFSTGGEIKSSISILGGRLYVGSNDFKVYCLNVGNGREIWNFSTGGWVFSTPAVADGRVYFGSCDGRVYCVDASTGLELWNFTAAYAPASPAIIDGVVVMGTYDNHMYFIDALTGEELGNYSEARSEIYSSAAVVEAAGRDLPDAYFGDNAGTFVALKDGVLDWSLEFTLLITSSPILAVTEDERRLLVYGVEDGLLVCVEDVNHSSPDDSEPEERWRLQLGTSISTSPFPYHNRIYVGAENGSKGLIACIGKLGNPGDTGRIVIDGPLDGAFVSSHVDVAFQVLGFEPLSAEVTVDGTVFPASQVAEQWRANIQLSGATRELLITARAHVENGVIIEEGVTVTFLEEGAQGPAVSILKPEPDVRVAGVVVARGTAEAERSILWVRARWDGEGEWRNATGTEDWVVALDTANLSDGSHLLNVEVFDGLLGESSVKVLVGDEDEDDRDITWLDVAIVAILVVMVAILMATKPRKKREIIPEDNTG